MYIQKLFKKLVGDVDSWVRGRNRRILSFPQDLMIPQKSNLFLLNILVNLQCIFLLFKTLKIETWSVFTPFLCFPASWVPGKRQTQYKVKDKVELFWNIQKPFAVNVTNLIHEPIFFKTLFCLFFQDELKAEKRIAQVMKKVHVKV